MGKPWIVGVILFAAIATVIFVRRDILVFHPVPSAVYKGTLPCADCPGIDATIALYTDGTYRQTYIYQERHVTSEEKGTWSQLVGKNYPMESIYQMSPFGANTKTYYLVSKNSLTPLDAEMNTIPAPYNTPLVKQ